VVRATEDNNNSNSAKATAADSKWAEVVKATEAKEVAAMDNSAKADIKVVVKATEAKVAVKATEVKVAVATTVTVASREATTIKEVVAAAEVAVDTAEAAGAASEAVQANPGTECLKVQST